MWPGCKRPRPRRPVGPRPGGRAAPAAGSRSYYSILYYITYCCSILYYVILHHIRLYMSYQNPHHSLALQLLRQEVDLVLVAADAGPDLLSIS